MLCSGGGGAFAYYKVRNLHLVMGKLNQTSYHSILQHHTIPSGMLFVDQRFVLMQDNDTKHTSKLNQKYIKSKEGQHILRMMSWLPQSADLNAIELMRNELDRKVRAKKKVQLTSGNSCRKAGQNYLQSLVERMHRICEALIAAKVFFCVFLV